MHLIVALLVIIILLLGGWWIFAIGFGLVLAAFGALIAAVLWLVRTLWPVLVVGVIAFLALGLAGIILEWVKSGSRSRPERKPAEPVQRPLPPISRTWQERRKPGND